jgi:tetratricopeptide (TPR) repeat protein
MSAQRRLMLTIGAFVTLLGFVGQALAEPVGVRAARTNDYGRIVFVWKSPVTHDLKLDKRRLTVRFGRPIEASYQRVLGVLQNYVSEVRASADGRSVSFGLKRDFDAYSFDSGRKVIVELAAPPPPKAKPKAQQVMSSVEVVRRKVAAQEAANGNLPKIRVRSGQHPDYSRIVFDWRNAVDYTLANQDGVVTVTFQRAAELQVARLSRNLPPYLGGIRARASNSATRVTMTVPKSSQIKHFLSGAKVVVDIRRPTGADETAALPPEPAPAKPPSPTVAPVTQAVTEAPKPEAAPEPSKAPLKPSVEKQQLAAAPTKAQAPPKLTDASVVSKKSEAEPQTPARALKPASPAARSQPVALQPVELRPGKKQKPKKPAAEDQAKAEGEDAKPVQPVDVRTGVKLRFDWDEPVAAAVFRRVGFVWVIFDKTSKVDTDALLRAGGTIIRSIEQAQTTQGTVLRIATRKSVNPSVARDGLSWILEFRKQDLRPSTPIEVKAQPNSPVGPKVFLPVPEPGKPIAITDPMVGDNLVVIPVIPLGHGVAVSYVYPQLNVLPTAQGVVIQAKIDDLRVRPLRQGIELTSSSELALSEVSDDVAASARLTAQKPLQKLLDLEPWELKDLGKFIERKQLLLADLAASRGEQREAERMNLVRFYFANGFHPEALGVLGRLQMERPDIADEAEFRLIRGGINYFMERLSDAAADLSHASLDNNDEANFWRAAVISASGDKLAAAAELRRTGSITREYPKALKMPMGTLVVEAAVEIGDIKTAKAFIDALSAAKPSENQQARLDYAEGRVLNVGGDVDGAISKWEEVLESRNRPVRARATMARLDLMLKLERMSVKEAIAILEDLRFAWRGDIFEFEMLRQLGGLYLDDGVYRNGLEALRQAATYYRDNEEASQVTEQMADVFSRLYLRDGADSMPAVTAIAVYQEFKELTPAGAKGDEMIRKLADRLASVDLLEQAAEILEGQIRFRLSGPLKAEVGARLAVIYLLARQYERAMAALDATNENGLETGLLTQRRHLRARSMMGIGQREPALELLKRDKQKGADSLRAEIFWNAGDWANASKALRRVAKTSGAVKETPLNEEQANHVLNYAISLTLSGNERGLNRLRRDFGRAFEATSMKDAFRLVTAPTSLGMIDPSTVTARVKLAENFRTFLGEYKSRLKEKGLSSLTDQSADAGNASNNDTDQQKGS